MFPRSSFESGTLAGSFFVPSSRLVSQALLLFLRVCRKKLFNKLNHTDQLFI